MRSKLVPMFLAALVLLAPAALVQASNPGNPIGAKGSRFARQHPRRDEINKRIAHQRSRIQQGLKTGSLTSRQARQLAGTDRSIKRQEHADVKANGGHLTAAEQKQFNQEENAAGTLIHDDAHPAPK